MENKGNEMKTMESNFDSGHGGKIYAAISAIMAEIGAIAKDRKNVQQGYAYRGIEDFYNAIHPLMSKYHVFSVPKVLSKEREERTTKAGAALIYTMLTVEYTFFAEDGSSITTVVTGEGMDSGDKSANKAMSVAHKYALAQIFCVPTADMTDPEVDSHEIEAKPKPVTKPVPPQEAEFLRNDLLAYLVTNENVVGKAKADILRESIHKHEGDAAWLKQARDRTIAEVIKQLAVFSANTKPATLSPTPLDAALGKLGATVGAKASEAPATQPEIF